MKLLIENWWKLLVILLALIFYLGLTFSGRLFIWGVSLNGTKLFWAKSQPDGIVAHRRNLDIIIKRAKPDNNSQLVASKISSLMDLYQASTTPYPEVITNLFGCPPEFLPVEIEVVSGRAFSLYANERKSFGVCSSDLIMYHSTYGVFDCGNKGVFEVGMFGDDNTVKNLIKNFNCHYD